MYLSSHPFSTAYHGLGHGGSILRFPSPQCPPRFQLIWGDIEMFPGQMRDVVSTRVLGIPRCTRNTSPGKCPEESQSVGSFQCGGPVVLLRVLLE